uniref:Uncharacterized protein n=1 Tax=Drosophila pseudoobscura pseudoobscura TaxID=46245 RepID=A0A0R3P3B3_DROPS
MACIVGYDGVVGERLCSGRPRCICRWYFRRWDVVAVDPCLVCDGGKQQDLLASGGPTPGHPALT